MKKILLIGALMAVFGFVYAADNQIADKTQTAQSCATTDNGCSGNWELFKSGWSDMASATSNTAKNTADQAAKYAKTGWQKTKETTMNMYDKVDDYFADKEKVEADQQPSEKEGNA
ncbi:MAG: hypothetical protein ACO2ZM_08780 [Francisellaceae bacterium]